MLVSAFCLLAHCVRQPGRTLGLALAFVAAGTVALSAQQPVTPPGAHPVLLDSALAKPHTVSPTSGPPGTRVTVDVSLLPAITPMWLGIGGTGSGFETLAFVQSDARGDLHQEVTVPSWAGRERSQRFIVFDAYFRPIAMTRPFHVTGQDGTILRQGQVGESLGSCASLTDQDGERYGLHGGGQLSEGEEVIVEGSLSTSQPCGMITTIEVTKEYQLRPNDR